MARYLLLPSVDTKASLESARGKHKLKPKKQVPYGKGERYFQNFLNALENYEDTQEWRTRSEFLALASIYLESRGRGLAFNLPGAERVAKAAAETGWLPDEERLRFLRMAACPLIATGDHQSTYRGLSDVPSDSHTENHRERLRSRRGLPYKKSKFLEYAAFVEPVFRRLGKPMSAIISDFLVHAWFEYHKDLWDLLPTTYEYHVNIAAWPNDKRDRFIADLIKIDTAGASNYDMKLGLTTRETFFRRVPKVIRGLARTFDVNLKYLEVGRLFGGLIRGEQSASSMPRSAAVWPGVEDQEFTTSVNKLLSSPALLDLASKEHCLAAVVTYTESELRVGMLDAAMPSGLVTDTRKALATLGMDLDRLPVKADYRFPGFWDVVYGERWQRSTYETPYTDFEKGVNAQYLGANSALFMMLDLREVHANLSKYLLDTVLPGAIEKLRGLIGANSGHIKNVRELFHHMGSLQKSSDEGDDHRGITLDHISDSAVESTTTPRLLTKMVKALRNRIRREISDAISDQLDKRWKTVASAAVSFED